MHWAWFVVAVWAINYRTNLYSSHIWNVAEYISLFAIVLMHEFGHQLACRSVGGKTHDIVLWPLGGVAYVSPPQRPGAMLWSIAAGPLVNVILVPVLYFLLVSFGGHLDLHGDEPNEIAYFLNNIWFLNFALLFFNMMPVFPLDGGQILRSLLWFIFGRANSLLIASVIGFLGVAGFILLAILMQSVWLGVLCVFIALNCWNGFKQAQALLKVSKAPRRDGFRCPDCGTPPPMGAFWRCGKCRQSFDAFETHGICPHCQTEYAAMSCPECGSLRPIPMWENYGQPLPPRM